MCREQFMSSWPGERVCPSCKTSRLHTAKILRLSEDLPMVIEIVDAEERIRTFLAAIEPMMTGGLITLEKAQVVRYGGEEEVS
jgi:hypothetical protein